MGVKRVQWFTRLKTALKQYSKEIYETLEKTKPSIELFRLFSDRKFCSIVKIPHRVQYTRCQSRMLILCPDALMPWRPDAQSISWHDTPKSSRYAILTLSLKEECTLAIYTQAIVKHAPIIWDTSSILFRARARVL